MSAKCRQDDQSIPSVLLSIVVTCWTQPTKTLKPDGAKYKLEHGMVKLLELC